MTKEDLAKELQDLQSQYFRTCAEIGDFLMNKDKFDSLITQKKAEAVKLQERADEINAESAKLGEINRADSAA